MAEKSSQYPKASWSDCIEFVKTVSSFNLKAVSYSEVAKKYGLTSPTAKSFTSKVSTAKQFGLITTTGGSTIQLTDTCKRILYPTGDNTLSIAKTCFGLPTLYAKLIATYDGKAVPSKDLLANILMNNHNIQKSVKDAAAQYFIESAEQLGLIKGGILCYSESEEDSNQLQISDPLDVSSETDIAPVPALQPIQTVATSESDYITQSVPCEDGKVAKIIIPVDASEDDLYLIHDMLNVVLKRKFKLEID